MVNSTLAYTTFGLGLLIALIAAILVMRHKTLPPNAQLNDFQIKESNYIGRTLFGLVVFLGFAAWAVILFTKGSQLMPEKTLGWAIFSSLCALIGIFLTSYFWKQKKQGRHAVIQKSTSTYTDTAYLGDAGEGAAATLQDNSNLSQPASEDTSVSTTVAASTAAAAGLAVSASDGQVDAHDTTPYQKDAALGTAATLKNNSNLAQPAASNSTSINSTAAASTATAAVGLAASSSGAQTDQGQQQSGTATRIPKQAGMAAAEHCQVPEDSVLRRHYLTKLRYDVEASLPPRPTDSVLKRHYETLINAEMEERMSP